ncbi:unnamed protein product, partial [Brassica rapa subsp. trilocularis]
TNENIYYPSCRTRLPSRFGGRKKLYGGQPRRVYKIFKVTISLSLGQGVTC